MQVKCENCVLKPLEGLDLKESGRVIVGGRECKHRMAVELLDRLLDGGAMIFCSLELIGSPQILRLDYLS